jgi:hypothetical protein
MDKPMDAYEAEDRIAQFFAEQSARLLRDLDRIEDRIAVIECVIRDSLARPTLH